MLQNQESYILWVIIMESRSLSSSASLPFRSDYAENAILQKQFNIQIISDLIEYLLRVKPSCKEKAISILDLCCGDGSATYHLLAELKKHDIKVSRIIGLDSSTAQIERANEYGFIRDDLSLEFICQDISQMSYKDEFDVVVSLFGLHWIKDLPSLAEKIFTALKEDGVTTYFVPLEKTDFFRMRQSVMQQPQWKNKFLLPNGDAFSISPFQDKHDPYWEAFGQFFEDKNNATSRDTSKIYGDQPVLFSREEWDKFLSSWMPEIRFLKSQPGEGEFLATAYLSDLLSEIQVIDCQDQSVQDVVVLKESIKFLEKFFWFYGQKRDKKENTSSTDPSLEREDQIKITITN